MMIIGYVISGQNSNNGLFFDGSEPIGTLCPECSSCLNFDYVPKSIRSTKLRFLDVSYTDDLRTLFSHRFVKFCQRELGCNEEFIPIDCGGETLFYMYPKATIEFDHIYRETSFEGKCSICNGFDSITGALPAFLKNSEYALHSGFYKSDIAFASGSSKFPLLFLSVDWMQLLSREKFQGINFEQVISPN